MSTTRSRRGANADDASPATDNLLVGDDILIGSGVVDDASRQARQRDPNLRHRQHINNMSAQVHSTAQAVPVITSLLAQLTALSVDRGTAAPTGKGPDARAPERFDGTDPSKLRTFLAQCRIVFLNHPRRFPDDRSKTLYAGSYLSGIAQDWFEPFTRDVGEAALVLENWPHFQERLEKVFGDSNAVATAEYRLSTLRMKETDHISNYITRFRTYAADLHWDDSPLKFAFRRGLAERILDELARADVPDTLSDLIERALRIDNRYWERQRERKLFPSARLGAQSMDHSSASNKTGGNRPQYNNNKKTFNKSDKTDRKPPRKDLDRVLTKTGRLNDAEKARRAEKGLCAYCGGPHKIDQCPVKPATANARLMRATSELSEQAGKE
jgi:hypothetical protein